MADSRLIEDAPTRRSGLESIALMRVVSSGVMIAGQFPGPRISRPFGPSPRLRVGSYARCPLIRADTKMDFTVVACQTPSVFPVFACGAGNPDSSFSHAVIERSDWPAR